MIPNAIDSNTFTPWTRDVNLGAELGLPSKAFIIGYVGSTVGYEGLDDLIQALNKV